MTTHTMLCRCEKVIKEIREEEAVNKESDESNRFELDFLILQSCNPKPKLNEIGLRNKNGIKPIILNKSWKLIRL